MKKMKKMLALLLTLCLLAGLVPLGAGAEEQTVDTSEELVQAITYAQNGDVIKLGGNITIVPKGGDDPHLYAQMTVQNDITLDLDGYKIDFDKETTSSELPYFPLMISVNQGGKLRITGNGTIDADCQDNGAYGIDVNGGEVIVENGTFYGAPTAIQVTKGSLIINGGSFDLCQANKDKKPEQAKYVINCIDKAWGDGTATISVTGGSFCYDYYHNSPETTGSSYIANGYIVIEKDGQYVVEKLDATNAVAQVGEASYFDSLSAAITAATENATVKLLKDTAETVTISKDKTLTLDLNGKTLSGSMKVIGNLTIQDSATGGTISNTGKIPVDGGRLTLKSGTISVEDDYGVYVLNGGSATINGGTISSKYSALAGNNTTGDMNFEVTGGTLTAEEGPAIYMPGQITMNISGGTLNGGISLRMGQITISGGTINATNGTIDAPQNFYNYSGNAAFPDALYVLNGTYTSQNETYKNSLSLAITGGTFNCANRQGSAVAIYDLGKVAQESKVTISGDAKFSTNAVERSAYQVLTLSDIGVVSPEGGYNNSDNVGKVSTSITSGYFTSDPSEYCPEGLTGLPGQYVVDGNTYQYMVGKKLENVTVATGETEAAKSEGVKISDADVKKIGETKADGLTQEANDTAADLTAADKATKEKYNAAADTLSKQIPKATDENITTVIAPRLEIEITGYDEGTAEATEKSLTLNIEAVYDIKATTATGDTDMVEYDAETPNASQVNTVTIEKNAGTLNTNGQDVVISIPLPTGFITETVSALPTIYVQHDNIYEYEAEVTETGTDPNKTYTATFTNPHGFSTFVLSTKSATVATVNGTNYTNFQQAVNAAGTSTIEVKADGQTATGVTHSLTLKNSDPDKEITVTINGEKITIPANDQVTFTYTAPTTPPRPTEEKHGITISTDGKGQVTGPASAAEDDKVTLTVKPNADKELYDLKVTDEDGKAIAVTKVNDTTYTFTMPDGKVTVAATFGCDGGDNCPSKAFTDLGDKQWYHDSIDYAVEHGLLEGTSPTTMEPNATLIRAQLAQILYNIEDKPAVTGEMVFEDVPASEWFYSPVLWANQNEIINGTSPTTFEPLEDISRQDLALMLYRYAGKPAVTGDLDGFTDADQVGDWAEEAMAWAVAEGIVQGDTPTTLNPTGTATRAEAAAMLQRFLEDAA